MPDDVLYEETVLPRRGEVWFCLACMGAMSLLLLAPALATDGDGAAAGLLGGCLALVLAAYMLSHIGGFRIEIGAEGLVLRRRWGLSDHRSPLEELLRAESCFVSRSWVAAGQIGTIEPAWAGRMEGGGQYGDPRARPRPAFIAGMLAPRHQPGPGMSTTTGVLIQLTDGRTLGFETAHPDEVLRVLGSLGVKTGRD